MIGGCYGIQIDGASNYYDHANTAVHISGDAVVSSGTDCLSKVSADDNVLEVTGGTFSENVSDYVKDVIPHPPQSHPQPGQQLIYRKRLCEVVACPGVQSRHLVLVVRPGGHHDNGHVAPGADLSDDLNTVHIRQPQIQQHHVRAAGQRVQNRLLTVFRPMKLVVLRFQCGGDEVAYGGVILHKQYLRFIHMPQEQHFPKGR